MGSMLGPFGGPWRPLEVHDGRGAWNKGTKERDVMGWPGPGFVGDSLSSP